MRTKKINTICVYLILIILICFVGNSCHKKVYKTSDTYTPNCRIDMRYIKKQIEWYYDQDGILRCKDNLIVQERRSQYINMTLYLTKQFVFLEDDNTNFRNNILLRYDNDWIFGIIQEGYDANNANGTNRLPMVFQNQSNTNTTCKYFDTNNFWGEEINNLKLYALADYKSFCDNEFNLDIGRTYWWHGQTIDQFSGKIYFTKDGVNPSLMSNQNELLKYMNQFKIQNFTLGINGLKNGVIYLYAKKIVDQNGNWLYSLPIIEYIEWWDFAGFQDKPKMNSYSLKNYINVIKNSNNIIIKFNEELLKQKEGFLLAPWQIFKSYNLPIKITWKENINGGINRKFKNYTFNNLLDGITIPNINNIELEKLYVNEYHKQWNYVQEGVYEF